MLKNIVFVFNDFLIIFFLLYCIVIDICSFDELSVLDDVFLRSFGVFLVVVDVSICFLYSVYMDFCYLKFVYNCRVRCSINFLVLFFFIGFLEVFMCIRSEFCLNVM